MKNIYKYGYIVISLLSLIVITCCEENEVQKADGENDDEIISLESFFFNAQSNALPPDKDLNLALENAVNKDTRNLNEKSTCNTHHEIFYKRLVSLLMSNIEIKEDGDIATGIVMIQAPYKKMELLRNLDNHKVSLRELDAILSEAIKKPEHSYLADFIYFTQYIFECLYITAEILRNNYEITIYLLSATLVIIISRRLKFHRGLSICVIIQIIFVISFFMTWWKLVQDAEIKLTAKQMQFSEIPISCKPHEMTMWDKFTTMIFASDDCQKYYEAVMTNPKLQVTPAVALSHIISTVILHPLENVGHTLSAFVNNATAELSWTYAWLVKIVLLIIMCCAVIVTPICLSGGSINFGLGPLLKFGLHGRKSDKAPSITHGGEKREPVQLILQIHHDGKQVTQSIANVSEAEKAKTVLSVTHKDKESNDDELKNAPLANSKSSLEDQQNLGAGDSILTDKCQMAITERGEECKKEKDQREEVGGGDFTASS